jgi:hypothetical protein
MPIIVPDSNGPDEPAVVVDILGSDTHPAFFRFSIPQGT